MAKENKNITNNDPAFKGDENAGKKGADDQGSNDAPPADTQPPAEQEKPKDKATILKEMRSGLKDLRQEDEKLEKEEDARGVICGKVATARHSRRAAIRDLESEIASIEKGK